MAVSSGWRLAVGRRRRLAAVGGWRLVAVGGWWLAVGGPLGRSLRAVLNKKKIPVPKDRPGWRYFSAKALTNPGGGLKWSGCNVRTQHSGRARPTAVIALCPPMPMYGAFHSASGDPTFSPRRLASTGCTGVPGSIGLCVRPGQGPLPSCVADAAGPIRPHPASALGGLSMGFFSDAQQVHASPGAIHCAAHTHTHTHTTYERQLPPPPTCGLWFAEMRRWCDCHRRGCVSHTEAHKKQERRGPFEGPLSAKGVAALAPDIARVHCPLPLPGGPLKGHFRGV